MKKFTSFALLISGIMASVSTVAAEKSNENILFSCHTTKNKILHVVERGKLISYSFSGYGGDSFSFETPKSDVKFQSEVISDLDFYHIEMNNHGYRYVISYSLDENDARTDIGVRAFDKSNKQVAEILCREFATEYQKIEKEYQQATKKIYRSGTYKVGVDIPAGEYKIIADGDEDGFFRVFTDSSNRNKSIVTGGGFENTAYVTVRNGQYLEVSRSKIVFIQ